MDCVQLVLTAAVGVAIMAVLVYYVWHKHYHVPKESLSEKQIEDSILYGCMHFTVEKAAYSIRDSKVLFPSKRGLHRGENDGVWFYICDCPAAYALNKYHSLVVKTRPECNYCIWFSGLTKEQLEHTKYNHNVWAFMHHGHLDLQSIRLYRLNNGGWEELL